MMNRLKIAQYIAMAATVMSVAGFILESKDIGGGDYLIGLGLITGLVSYLFGGLFKMLGMAIGIAKWGLIAFPFPHNLMSFPVAFMLAVVAFIFLPIIPVRKAYLESGWY
jgi:hypothetical protein